MTMGPDKKTILETLEIIENKDERFAYIIDLGKNLKPLENAYKTDAFKIEGCVSNLWLVPENREGRLYFSLDADAVITRGVGALVITLFSGLLPREVLDQDEALLKKIGITQYLTPNRRNGLANLTKKINDYAHSFLINN